MAFFDLPEEALATYRPAEEAPKDFDVFWADTVAPIADAHATFTRVQSPIYHRRRF